MRRQPARRDLVTLQEFRWHVAVDGYEWVAAVGQGKGPGVAVKPDFRDVDLAEVLVNPGLFVDFAQVSASREGILEFVHGHGLLGISGRGGESQADWRRHVGRMRKAIDLARSGRSSDRTRAASIANEQLDEYSRYRLVRDPESGLLRPRCVPTNLLGAMWVQFACTVDTDARYETCDICGRTMLFAPWLPGGRRGQSKYCSNACNQKAKRIKAKAGEMRDEGIGRRAVAKKLGVTEAWLRKRGL